MKLKSAVFVLLVAGLVLAVFEVSKAVVDLRRIEEVLKKNVLTQQDLQIIDEFMKDAVTDLVRTTDFTQVSKTRTIIVSHKSSQAQYAQQYSESSYRHIAEGLQQAKVDIRDEGRRFKVIANLLILVDRLKDPRLVDLAIAEIRHPSSAVRYWAIRAATDAGLWGKLSQDQSAAAQVAGRILTECSAVVDGSSPEVLNLIAEFAGRSGTAEADPLLLRIADARIARYADWSVKYELMDGAVLRLLCDKLVAGGPSNPRMAQRFGQLFSFVLQRYMAGQRDGAINAVSANHLISVMMETEEKCLGRLLDAPQATIRRAVEAKDLGALQAEHDRLLGAGNQAGSLSLKFSVKYGPAGENRPAPLTLPERPQRTASNP